MKRFIILLVMLLPLTAMAQTPTFKSLFEEYSTKENCTTINISNAMLKAMDVNISAEYMQVIAVNNEELTEVFKTQVLEALKGLEVVMSVNNSGQAVKICQQKNGAGVVTDMYVMSCGNKECVLMKINGHNLELSNIGSIMNKMQ